MNITIFVSYYRKSFRICSLNYLCRITGGADGPDKVFVGGLPYYLTEVQIKELLESFGYASKIYISYLKSE